jgi:hypothetical protein
MAACALAGGYLTACVGFGADLCLYTFGHLVWNRLLPHRCLSDHALSASSVVAMGALSSITALTRAVTGGLSSSSLHCWGAAACIVCIGAPIGSLLLTDKAADAVPPDAAAPFSGRAAFWQRAVRGIFYLLAFCQLLLFAQLRPPPPSFWWRLAGCAACLVALLAVHALALASPSDLHGGARGAAAAAAAAAAGGGGGAAAAAAGGGGSPDRRRRGLGLGPPTPSPTRNPHLHRD